MLDKQGIIYYMRNCPPLKGPTFATMALAGKDVALAGLGYRGSGSRELLIEKGGALGPRQP